MKKGLLFFLLLFLSISVFTQTIIRGKVTTSSNEILEGASVYLNNTTIGTTTDDKGEFELKIKQGNFDLVVSFIGYKSVQIKIDTSTKIKFFTLKLIPNATILNEVIIKKTKYDKVWKYNLSRFKQAFLGRTKLAKECKILNPKVLHFEYNQKINELTAEAREPLQIKNRALGYIITYDLVDFSIKGNRLYYSGYARYKNLKKSIRKKWKKNRLEAYNGSQMQFFRSLISQKLKEDGFVVNQFKRVLNPQRPTKEKIKFARELIRLHNNRINFSKKITKPITALDSALVIVRKSRKPKYVDYLYKRNVSYEEMLSFEGKIPFLNFENYLSVIYTKETEEDNYLIGIFGKKKRSSGVQTSSIVLLNGKAKIDKSGILINPNGIFNEGYWGFEAFANMLPLDYQPPKN